VQWKPSEARSSCDLNLKNDRFWVTAPRTKAHVQSALLACFAAHHFIRSSAPNISHALMQAHRHSSRRLSGGVEKLPSPSLQLRPERGWSMRAATGRKICATIMLTRWLFCQKNEPNAICADVVRQRPCNCHDRNSLTSILIPYAVRQCLLLQTIY
jgi:hypothetical protein